MAGAGVGSVLRLQERIWPQGCGSGFSLKFVLFLFCILPLLLTPASLPRDPDLKAALVSRPTDRENRLVVAAGDWGRGGMGEKFGMSRCKLPYIETR